MWTNENRGRYDRSKLRYPSDLTDAEWLLVGPLIPPAKRGGDRRTVDVREVVDGIGAKGDLPAAGELGRGVGRWFGAGAGRAVLRFEKRLIFPAEANAVVHVPLSLGSVPIASVTAQVIRVALGGLEHVGSVLAE